MVDVHRRSTCWHCCATHLIGLHVHTHTASQWCSQRRRALHKKYELMLMRRAAAVAAGTARFEGGTQIWRPRTEDSLNLVTYRGRGVETYTTFYARLSCSIFQWFRCMQYTLEMCRSLKSQKIDKKSILLVQGHRCWYSGEVRQQCLFMICSKSVSICSRSHARRFNSGKITISYAGILLWRPRSMGISSPSVTKCAHKTDYTL